MLYVAYGSNLNKEQMARRCPLAKPIAHFTLPDARLVFRGVADVERSEGDEVECGLWEITKACERALDRYEGVSSGLYRKEYLKLAVTRDGKRKARRALIYLMNSDHYDMPSAYYLGVIRKGYKDFGIDFAKLTAAVEKTRDLKRRMWLRHDDLFSVEGENELALDID
ncbi:gamma-glutamylcyclotransferase [Rhodoplanes sp. TEM]|uniref:Gamma-glutamylcyclotransferase n=1 Tax=Rhodoplanes tepidamans TaxID=200616 RepID=A0ABT5J576_RHOTP|nr:MULTISPECIES: gamma-glutamylcyclotransferase family protein [Rhodoplanes]MDC7784782.1 gamma-glutamylcyclotransferase [Rhodoplanes tepidamans]MDC7982249.1 gamma-glutamylcyclotransferase [Rhodoplanes sp. TEM]MDQ0356256.1 hypothetical protein [Rhodoplanes tepidamans]